GLVPSNVDRGYILRRLIRRAVRYARNLGIEGHFTSQIAEIVMAHYKDVYPELAKNEKHILAELKKEEEKFSRTLDIGMKESQKLFKLKKAADSYITGAEAFDLYATYGFPIEMTEELAKEQNLKVDLDSFNNELKKHQALSRKGAEQKFKGGLADHSTEVVRYHTATHLLHKALRDVLGNHVEQRGSNITKERLRFDFVHPDKMTPEQIKKVEDIINNKIAEDLKVSWKEMTVDEAKSAGAMGLFEERYGDKVKVYSIGEYSKEICGGPHVRHTAKLGEGGQFKILKEEAVSAGIRRIKAVLAE
ncbi:alanine--tRNA ligase, partial [Candidatus Uhrbacteria bacterium]|nr:alanine--tRNA ligase [Candidatus Uhrbacteria bacterium]